MTNSIIDHLTVGVKNFNSSNKFYNEVLGALGYGCCMQFKENAAFGTNGHPCFWISGSLPPSPGLHYCFTAVDRPSVDSFYKTALKLGGKDNGAPGLRDYAPDYYAAYVIDLDGYKIEAVCRH